MGNVRNPVGPLPSSIYWRRRAVVLCLFALLVALIVWAVTSGGSGNTGGNGAQGPSDSRSPVSSITPGPTTSQTGITQRPGGRDTSGGGDGGAAAGGGTGGSDGGADSGQAGGGSGGGGSAGGTGGSSGSGGGTLPIGSTLPDCTGSTAHFTVRSLKSSYAPGEQPVFEVTVSNSGGSSCKVNVGGTAAVVTVTTASGGSHVWASDDCPASRGAALMEVRAGGSVTYRVQWNRALTAPQCATPAHPGSAQPGSYRVEVAGDGLGTAQAAFVLTSS